MKVMTRAAALLNSFFIDDPAHRVSRRASPAQVRAAERLAKKRKTNEAIPDTSRYTRQQARAERRRIIKSLRSLRKVDAMKTKQPGGAAVVR